MSKHNSFFIILQVGVETFESHRKPKLSPIQTTNRTNVPGPEEEETTQSTRESPPTEHKCTRLDCWALTLGCWTLINPSSIKLFLKMKYSSEAESLTEETANWFLE